MVPLSLMMAEVALSSWETIEPPRDGRRLVGVSHAAMAVRSLWA
jgi:hypothetical protein